MSYISSMAPDAAYRSSSAQARERAERERAAREALQAESAVAKAAIMQRSKSERAAAVAVAAPSPSAGGAAISMKESSPLGPKAPSTIGSYVRQPSPARAAGRSSAGGGTAGALSTPGSEASVGASCSLLAAEMLRCELRSPCAHLVVIIIMTMR